MAIQPRGIAVVGLLALVPVLAYAATQPDTLSAIITGINVVVIVSSLVVALRPVGRGVAWG
ncbi:MAG: cytochrome-ba3 oxidase subunit [Salinirussus sp.]